MVIGVILLSILGIQASEEKKIGCKTIKEEIYNEVYEIKKTLNNRNDIELITIPSETKLGYYRWVKKDSLHSQLTRYDFTYEIDKRHFEWKRKFFHNLQENLFIDHKVFCYINEKEGYFWLKSEKKIVPFYSVIPRMSLKQLMHLFVNIIEVLRTYRKLGAIFVEDIYDTFSVDAEEITNPAISNFSSVIDLNGTCYVPENFRKIPTLFHSFEGEDLFLKAKPSKKLYSFILLTVLKEYSERYYNFHKEKKENMDTISSLSIFINYLDKSLESARSGNFKRISPDKIKRMAKKIYPNHHKHKVNFYLSP